RKEARHGRGPKARAEIIEGVPPTVVDAVLLVGCDAAMGEFLTGVITGSGEHQGTCALRLQMMHVGHDRGADGASDQDGWLAVPDLVNCLPTALRRVLHGEPGARLGPSAIARNLDVDAAAPGR